MSATAMRRTAIGPAKIKASVPGVQHALALLTGAAATLALGADPAEALPAYARQTGQPCAACHTAFPELTPFGGRFKIGGYTLQGGNWQGPPIAAFYMTGFTHTKAPQDAPPAPGLHTNDNLVSQQAPGFIAGRLADNLGSFIQITGDPVGGTAFLDLSDIRYADTLKLFGKDTIWGIDANNSPTVEDPVEHDASVRLASYFLDDRPCLRSAADPHRKRLRDDRRRRGRLPLLGRHALRRRHRLQGSPGTGVAGAQRRQFNHRRSDQCRA